MSHNANDILDKQRFGLITGSKCHVLFPKKSAEVGQRTYAKQLANEMYFEYYDNTSTWQMEHGNNAESSAFEYYCDNFDRNIDYKPPFAKNGNFGGSADAVADVYGIDFKCPTSLEKWLDFIHEPLPKEHFYQCQMYMFLYNKPLWKIVAYLIETEKMSNSGEVYPVKHNERMICVNVIRDNNFEAELLEKSEPVIKMRDEFYAKLIEQFGDKLPF